MHFEKTTSDQDEVSTWETKSFQFWAADREMTVDAGWGDSLFASPSNIYNADLALVSSVLSMAAYDRGGAHQDAGDVKNRHGYYIEDTYRKLGFMEEKIKLFSYPGHPKNQTGYEKIDGSDNDLAFAIADKTISIGGSSYNLIVITLRGSAGIPLLSPDWQRDICRAFSSNWTVCGLR